MELATLLGYLGRGLVLLALVAVAQLALRRRAAGLRYSLWCAALGALIALPVLGLLVPPIEVSALAMEPALEVREAVLPPTGGAKRPSLPAFEELPSAAAA